VPLAEGIVVQSSAAETISSQPAAFDHHPEEGNA